MGSDREVEGTTPAAQGQHTVARTVSFIRLIDPVTKDRGAWVAFNESSDDVTVTLTIGGCLTSDGLWVDEIYHQYDSYEVYHVPKWAEERGLIAEFATAEVVLPA